MSGLSDCKPRKGYLALESEGAECHFRNLRIKELPSSNPTPEETTEVAKGFHKLYTGLDLAGWKADAAVAEHWRPRNGILHGDGKGAALTTDKEFGDAEFLVDFRSPRKGAAAPGVFLFRGNEEKGVRLSLTNGKVIVRSPGGEATPEISALKPAGQWNRLRVSLKDNAIRVAINGKDAAEATVADVSSRGTFALRPEGEMDFMNLFVRELGK